MTVKERVLHAVLFEVIALFIFVILAVLITEKAVLSMTGLAVTLSTIAMIWNYIYNLGFDHIYGYDRMACTVKMRIAHGLGFEVGMLVFSFPIIMWVMKFGFIEVLIMDIGAAIFFLLYAIAFSWLYDIVREKYFVSKKQA